VNKRSGTIMQRLHRSVIVQVGQIGVFSKSKVQLGDIQRSFHAGLGLKYLWNREFRTSLRMMVDTSATEKGVPSVDVLPEKDEDGGFASGGWKRLIWVSFFIIFGLYVIILNYTYKRSLYLLSYRTVQFYFAVTDYIFVAS
jgi:hypothetical protein